MKQRHRLGFVGLAALVCVLLLALVPAAFASCVDFASVKKIKKR